MLRFYEVADLALRLKRTWLNPQNFFSKRTWDFSWRVQNFDIKKLLENHRELEYRVDRG